MEMTGDANGPCGMYTYAVAPTLKMRRPPPNLLPAPMPPMPSRTGVPPANGSGVCSRDPPKCSQAFSYGNQCQGASSLQAMLTSFCAFPGVNSTCPCWCSNSTQHYPLPPHSSPASSPPPIIPVTPWQSVSCPTEFKSKACRSQTGSNATLSQMCAKNVTFRSACLCSCQVITILLVVLLLFF